MQIIEKKSLLPFNTFGIEVYARYFAEIQNEEDIREALEFCKEKSLQPFLLNGGSNMLLLNDLDTLVMHLQLKGKKVIHEDEHSVEVQVEAGENWDEFVQWSVANNWGGLENLILIPGNVGTAPIQNIGAYGVEIKDCLTSLDAIRLSDAKVQTFQNKECNFGYRESVFKNELKGEYIISSVRFRLQKAPHTLHTEYGAIRTQLQEDGISQPSIADVANAVKRIRQSKLPDPAEIGNSGSFFKNPVISSEQFDTIYAANPNMPHYRIDSKQVKVPAGWLIEQCGWKGYRRGDAGVHEKQALVLVNHGKASGMEIRQLALDIQESVKRKFGIDITPEVNIIQ